MSIWQNGLTLMVRSLISDLGNTQTYSDERIQLAIIISMMRVVSEFPASTSYTFSIQPPDVSPDPLDEATFDLPIVILTALATACMLNTNSFQDNISNNIKIKDGDTSVDTSGQGDAYKVLLAVGPCESYKKILKTQSAWASMNRGKMIAGGGLSHPDFWASSNFSNVWNFGWANGMGRGF